VLPGRLKQGGTAKPSALAPAYKPGREFFIFRRISLEGGGFMESDLGELTSGLPRFASVELPKFGFLKTSILIS